MRYDSLQREKEAYSIGTHVYNLQYVPTSKSVWLISWQLCPRIICCMWRVICSNIVYVLFIYDFWLITMFQTTARDMKIQYLSKRQLSNVWKPASVLELVWAYNDRESERRCAKLRRALLHQNMNVNKRNRKNQAGVNLFDIRWILFIYLYIYIIYIIFIIYMLLSWQ